ENGVVVGGLDPIGYRHAFEIDAGDVFRTADRDGFALEVLPSLDRGLRQERVWGRLHLDPHNRNRGALVDGADWIGESGRQRNIQRSRRELLGQRGARLDETEIELEVPGREIP